MAVPAVVVVKAVMGQPFALDKHIADLDRQRDVKVTRGVNVSQLAVAHIEPHRIIPHMMQFDFSSVTTASTRAFMRSVRA